MPVVDVVVSCDVQESFAVRQVSGLFDVPPSARLTERFRAELPDRDGPWQIGVLVGPSGSGKSTIARTVYGRDVYVGADWKKDHAVIDHFGDASIRDVTRVLTAVGFSSPPSWLKPYAVLSTGEKFRCELARALLSDGPSSDAPAADVPLADAPSSDTPLSDASLTDAPFADAPLCDVPTTNARSTDVPLTNAPLPDVALSDPAAERRDDKEGGCPLVVFDEFTSVVDRTVAQMASAAVAKSIRRGTIAKRLIAVTCHYDVLPWLEPDWHFDTATGRLFGRSLRRPPISLEVVRCERRAWPHFARYHYLSGKISGAAECYLATCDDRPVAFCGVVGMYGRRGHKRITRLVTLPDFQGVGIGMRLAESVGEIQQSAGVRLNITASHPAVVAHAGRSPRWRTVGIAKTGHPRSDLTREKKAKISAGRSVVSFEYVGR
jgi:GNAT superfamily N-acetyltransferase